VDSEKVEMPKAPGGMTGGVEYEAVQYMTSHLKLVNALALAAAELNLPASDELSAYRFHSDLFASGFERILVTTRKASTAYYPSLHLEIARYVSYAARTAQYELPWSLARYIGLPPSHVMKGNGNAVGGSKATKISISAAQPHQAATPARQAIGALPPVQGVSPLK